jgi:transcriptional regulator with XRE-family HTH domain
MERNVAEAGLAHEDIVKERLKDKKYLEHYLTAGETFDVAELLEKVVEEEAIGVRELARRMGTSPAYVSRLVNNVGNGSCTVRTLSKFARATGRRLRIEFVSEQSKGVQLQTLLEVLQDIREKLESVQNSMPRTLSFSEVLIGPSGGARVVYQVTPQRTKKQEQLASLTPQLAG